MLKLGTKRGDTLIEVMLAVGIFSMVAISVVAVMSSGTTGSQTALETTLTREEIDAQAEALRFIHRAYIADKNTQTNSHFGTLWREIVSRTTSGTPYHPQSCQDVYNNLAGQNAFILNIANLGVIDSQQGNHYSADKVLIRYDSAPSKFTPAATYPHLIYDSRAGASSSDASDLIDRNDNASTATTLATKELYRAEGIYVIAAPDTTGSLSGKATFYDFYIRTCWYGAGEQAPSTISTVIRLYNPDLNE